MKANFSLILVVLSTFIIPAVSFGQSRPKTTVVWETSPKMIRLAKKAAGSTEARCIKRLGSWKRGDADGDGERTQTDASIIAQYVENGTGGCSIKGICDFNRDGEITSTDVDDLTAFLATGAGDTGEIAVYGKLCPEPASKPTPAPTKEPLPGVPTPKPTPKPTPPPANSSYQAGHDLWVRNCNVCHPNFNQGALGASSSKIGSAIDSNKGGMGILKGRLSSSDLANLSYFLSNSPKL